MEITLNINGEEKVFTAPFVSARRLKETLALSNKIQDKIDEKTLDELGEYIVNLYGKQFSLDDLLDGFSADLFFSKAIEDIQTVVGNFGDKVKN